MAIYNMMKQLKDLSWTGIMLGAYYQALKIRGIGHIRYIKMQRERKEAMASEEKFSSFKYYLSIFWYLYFFFLVILMVTPGMLVNYVTN